MVEKFERRKVLILAEKPSQAQDISKAFKNCKKKNGYIECGNYIITWGYGHLLEIDTEKIAPTGETIVFPEKFEYRPRSKLHAKQLKIIKGLLKKVDEVYVFTDPEREGELIGRLILQKAGWKNWERTYRMWTSKALTPDVIWEELKAKKPIKNFDSVFWEALARQHADWLVGIPLSRVLIKNLKGSWSVGRVQTPTLALIVQKEEEREKFKPQPYYVVKGIFLKEREKIEGVLTLKEIKEKVKDEEEENREEEGGVSEKRAKEIIKELKKTKFGVVVKVEKKRRREKPPLLHSLTTLQKEASKFFGYSAQKTLQIAQSLYEKKLISYPRTESQYLSEKDKQLVKDVLKKLGKSELIPNVEKVRKRVFDDSKLTDHFALIPLDKAPENLTKDEKNIYFLIWRKFVGAFMDDYEYEETSVLLKVGEYEFKTKGKKVINLGWKALYGEEKDKLLPELREGEKLKLEKIKSERRITKPPSRYTDGSIISKMKKLGIGTPATRSQIVESLISRGYIRRKGKELIPTPKGIELVKKLLEKDLKIAKVELTSEWERKLKEIRERKLNFKGYRAFLEEIKKFVKENARELEKIEIPIENQKVYTSKRRKNKKFKSQTSQAKKFGKFGKGPEP